MDNPTTGLTTSITVKPCAEAIGYYQKVFGATEITERMEMDDGSIAHAEIEIEGTRLMLADEWPDAPNRSPRTLGGVTAVLFLYTTDVDTLWGRAIEAGATEVFPLQNQFYGDRSGRIEDPFGVQWTLSQQLEVLSDEEMKGRADEWMAENR